ncbi:hypothetical protein FRACYDRAFT_268201 [Fragilariopsis cylindrus CCMP1102]|uniref:Uncharacterized protein n=1 Tax=Fragilariopsis cylindrus CCMP1102 TaxID=635003 RepID=A0A1E7FQ39_9STRA|nr:hypothetical protein FRACYDRAFT_268201 [Fragilariopsis cylindrus CCMP1102]|eukprot:OEU20215.1 hypothetical protein FRACYDRAFT_268201 [Fragilariopsis cylindrus CCMP1102]
MIIKIYIFFSRKVIMLNVLHGSVFAPDKNEIAISFITAVICHYSSLMNPISIGIFWSFFDPIRLLFLLLGGQ